MLYSIPPVRGDTGGEVGPIALESRKSVYLAMRVAAEGEEMLDLLKSADRVEFVAKAIPSGEEVRKSLSLWDDIDPQ